MSTLINYRFDTCKNLKVKQVTDISFDGGDNLIVQVEATFSGTYFQSPDTISSNRLIEELISISKNAPVPIKAPTYDGEAALVKVELTTQGGDIPHTFFLGDAELYTITCKERNNTHGLLVATKMVLYCTPAELPDLVTELMYYPESKKVITAKY